ncbi:MAG: transglutaminase domain-containing protein, partial [Myxococcales bacterium]|nr:transglutaminase domain-containing protein [Myxococcales bacterium]
NRGGQGQKPQGERGGADGGSGQAPSTGEMDSGTASGQGADGGVGDAPPPQQDRDAGTPTTPPPQDLDKDDTYSPQSQPAPMAVVVFEDDYEAPSQSYYFRQGAWSQWNGSRLVPATVPGADPDVLLAYPDKRVELPVTKAGRHRVRTRVAMMAAHDAPFALETPRTFEPVRNTNPERFTRMYRAESWAQEAAYDKLLKKKAGDPHWSDELRSMYLEPHSDERYLRLAEEITEALPDEVRSSPFAKAVAIKVWLDKELTYSTRERHRGGSDPTTHFLFGNRVGYCVHFAHAAVMLWRAVGIPARIGNGYMVAEENRRGGSSLLIRSNDAHAWPELYLEGMGWVVLDISAEHVLDEAGAPLDEDLQRMLGDMAREPVEKDEALDDREVVKRPWFKWALGAVLGFALLALVALYGWKGWRRAAPAFANDRDYVRVAYRACLDALSDAGLVREFGETREAFARRVAKVAPTFVPLT